MADMNGKVALVTGAGRGIGAQTAIVLARAGAAVMLAARTVAPAEAVAQGIRAAGGQGRAVRCDVADYDDVAGAVASCREAFGRLDILVNNAGVIEPIGALAGTDPAAWGRAIDVNLKGVYHGLRAALPGMVAQRAGVIVTISSGAAATPIEGWSAYCAGKAGAAMLTRHADLEYRAQGVRVVGLSPGTVATRMQEVIRASGINRISRLDWAEHIPADWAARAVAWLCTDAGAEFAGQDVSLRDPAIRARIGLTA